MPDLTLTDVAYFVQNVERELYEWEVHRGTVTEDKTEAIVRAWHNDTHRWSFESCEQQPCHAIVHAKLP